jgi:two-component system, OmpR family, sensor histidine kinase CiaH
MFEKARLKLTLWYLLIIMTISLLFTGVIYARVNSDLVRFEQAQIRMQRNFMERGIMGIGPGQGPNPQLLMLTPEDIQETRQALIIILGLINLIILAVSGGAGYFLAGKTLRPIKEMVDEQNRFISDSSHELRTPLTSLRSEIEVNLRNKNLTLGSAKKVLESNLEEVINLQKLSDNLLELAQSGNLVSRKNMKPVSIFKISVESIDKIRPLASKKQIKIENKVKDAKINAIPDRITEALIILLDNAVKYSPSKSTIEIKSEKIKDYVKIMVVDHGAGIPNEDLPHIFQRFYRSDKSRNQDGYGLGLSIAKEILESHKGSISVKSELGKGSIFTVKLPLS